MNTTAKTDQLAGTFDQFEDPETRQTRWEAAALADGREVDRNALRAYMAVADAEQQKLADDWARTGASSDAEIRRLKAHIRELERPAIEAKRNEIRQSFAELAAQCREDRDFEGAFNVECDLREREEQWAAEDAVDCPGFEREYQGVSDAKRRLANCKHCGQPRTAHAATPAP
ncbi:hypothetical protein [Streptomyces sp. NPDC056817]|uniref:hypothetical protein n=1 Tax=Streptomyces sp. NPDC056817 TaxID=3345950 RepID=UPI0036877A70